MRQSARQHSVLQTSLRVLKAYTEHRTPKLSDIELLKKHMLPSEVDLPIDDLASSIIRRELERRKAAVVS